MRAWILSESGLLEAGYKTSSFADFNLAKEDFFKSYSVLERLVKEWRQNETPIPLLGGKAINSTFYLEALRDKRTIFGSQEETIRVRVLCKQIKDSGGVATHAIDWLYFTEISAKSINN